MVFINTHTIITVASICVALAARRHTFVSVLLDSSRVAVVHERMNTQSFPSLCISIVDFRCEEVVRYRSRVSITDDRRLGVTYALARPRPD